MSSAALAILLAFLFGPTTQAQDVTYATFDPGDPAPEIFVFSELGPGVWFNPTDDASGTPDHALAINVDPSSTGGFVGWVLRPALTDVSGTRYLTFQIRTEAMPSNLPIVLEVNLHEDVNGDGFTGDDDEYQALYTVTAAGPYTTVSIPLSAFTDDNSVFAGSDDGIDLTKLYEVVLAWVGPTGPTYTLSFDEFVFTDLPNVEIEYLGSTDDPQRDDFVFVRALGTNNESETVRTRVYTEVLYPNGLTRRYSVGSSNFPANTSLQIQQIKRIKFPIPSDAPEGTYTVTLIAAQDIADGGGIYDTDTFTFDLGPIAPPKTGEASGEAGPNPFTTATTIRYELEADADVSLRVFDVQGREVAMLASGVQTAGAHSAVFAAGDLPGGVYVWRLTVDGSVSTGRVTLAR